jgi:alpha-L-fucosidase
MKKYVLIILVFSLCIFPRCNTKVIQSKKAWDNAVADPAAAHLPRPTKVQYNWQEMERAMFVQLDPATLQQGEYDNGTTKLEDIRFEKLDVNEWCDVAKSWGAQEVVFMLAHSGGFCMWPSATTKYHIGNTSYQNGKGDVVKDFAAACRTHGLKAGFYLWSPHTPEVAKEYNFVNAGYKYTPVNTMEESNAILRQRLREIHQRLGSDLVREVWFDHPRHVSASQEMKELFPEAVVMAVACIDPLPTIRWPGTETGKVKDPCWSTLKKDFLDSRKYPEIKDNLMQDQSVDDPDGDYWAPHEADVPLHDHFWHMRPDALNHRLSVAALMDCYEKSVGRNSFLILNCAPMPDGSIHPDDIKRYREFGEEIDRRFGHPVSLTEQVPGNIIMLNLGGMKNIGYTDLWEDYRYGQRIREYVIEGYDGNNWIELARGTSVGHRKIDPVGAKSVTEVRVRITKSVGTPLIRRFQVHSPS